MIRDVMLSLKQQILHGLNNGSSASYWHSNRNFDCFLNAYILLSVKLNYTLIEEYPLILNSIPHQIERPNIVNFTNGLAQLGYATKRTKGCKNLSKLKLPCLISKGDMINDEVRILFRENDIVVSYNPFDNTYQSYDQASIDSQYYVYQFELFNLEQFDLGKGVLKFLNRTWFAALLLRFKFVITKLVIVSIFLHLFSLILPCYIIYTYNRVVESNDTSNFFMVTCAVIFLLICEQVLRFFRAGVLSWLGCRVDYIVTNEVLNKFCRLPLSVIENLSIPSQIARIRSFISVRDFFTGPIFSTLLELPAIILMIILVGYFNYLFTLIFAVNFLVLVFAVLLFHKVISGYIRKVALFNTEKYYLTSIYLDKIDHLHYQGLEKYYTEKLKHLSEQATHYTFQSEFFNSLVDNFGKLLTNVGILTILCTGIYLIWHNEISVAVLLATIFLAWRIFLPIQVASSTMVRSEKIFRTLQQIDAFLDFPDEQDKKGITLNPQSIKNSLRLLNIGVFYPTNKQFILRNFSLEIKLGEFIVISGESGSGKSTILKLMTGYIKPNLGKILIDQYDIKQINIQSLRGQFCYIHQEDSIINGTIYENISIINPLLSKTEIDKIVNHLNLADEFNKLPQGLNTLLSPENPQYTSKNLLKSIALIRLYASSSTIKLIDGLHKEFFSAQTWGVFVNDLTSWRGNHTILMISDDPAIGSLANHVVKL